MPVMLVYPQNSSGGGSVSSDGHSHSNLALLEKLSSSNGNLLFNKNFVGEKALETVYNLILTAQQISQKSIELPEDCDTSRAIVLTLQGISMQQGTFWEVIEKTAPEKDLISWKGLELESIAQVGDSISISYYKKI